MIWKYKTILIWSKEKYNFFLYIFKIIFKTQKQKLLTTALIMEYDQVGFHFWPSMQHKHRFLFLINRYSYKLLFHWGDESLMV